MSLNRIGVLEFEAGEQKFRFRPLVKKDQDELIKFAKRNQGVINGPFPVTTEALTRGSGPASKWIDDKISQSTDEKGLVCVIETADNKRVIGYISAFLFDWRVPKCEIAWMVDSEFQRKGIATMCCKFMLDFLVHECDMQKVISRIDPKNTASVVLAGKLGFEAEGHHKKDFRDGFGRLLDVDYYALLP